MGTVVILEGRLRVRGQAGRVGPMDDDTTRKASLVRVLDWLFRDRSSGRYVVAQWPNAALIVFLLARVAEWALGPEGTGSRIIHWLGTAALLWWSAGELGWGVNPFRRILGGVVMTVLAFGIVRGALD